MESFPLLAQGGLEAPLGLPGRLGARYGTQLLHVLREDAPLDPGRALHILVQACRALREAGVAILGTSPDAMTSRTVATSTPIRTW